MSALKIVHLFNFSKGSRYHSMISQGLHLHPDIEPAYAMPFISLGARVEPAASNLHESMAAADYIFRCDDEHFGFEDVDRFLDAGNLWHKVVYYDFRDSPDIDTHRLDSCCAYIKRSWTIGANRAPRPAAGKPLLPLDFCMLGEYFVEEIPEKKDVDIAYLFPPKPDIGQRRYAVYEELSRQKQSLGNSVIGKYTAGFVRGRRALFEPPQNNPFLEYLRMLKRSRIVFTAYPDNWDGDSRTWEAFSSGALIFMDATTIPTAHPFIHGKHCFTYDARDRDSIRDAIAIARYFLKNDLPRRAIASEGYRHACNYHRPINRIETILQWIKAPEKSLARFDMLHPRPSFLRYPYNFNLPARQSLRPDTPLPSFLGIGAQKAATTWVHENLSRHPDIFMPRRKELHFFDGEFQSGFNNYAQEFAGGAGKVCGEITPAYAMLLDDEVRQVAALLPDVRVFFIVRNPIERAWSAARMDLEIFYGDEKPLSEVREMYFAIRIAKHESLLRGNYAKTIATWKKHIPHERFRVFLYDRLCDEPESFLRELFAFLEIDSSVDLSGFPLQSTPRKGTALAMPPNIAALLEELLEKRIDELEHCLQIDLSAWRRDAAGN